MKSLFLLLPGMILLLACDPDSGPAGEPEITKTVTGSFISTSNKFEQPMPEKRPYEVTVHGHTRVD